MAFHTTRRIGFGDCDPAGITYFPTYLHILVGVVEEFFHAVGKPWPDLIAQRRIGLPTVRLYLTFAAPTAHGDQLDFRVAVAGVGRSSLVLEHAITCGERLCWAGRQVIVATSLDTHTSIAWPDDIRAALTPHLEIDHAYHSAA